MITPRFSLTCLLPCAGLLLSLAVQGKDPAFAYGTRTLELPEIGVVTNWVIRTGTGAYAFMPPNGWRFEAHPGEPRLVWVAADTARISITAQTRELLEVATASPDRLEQYVKNRLPQGDIRGQTRIHTEGESGTAFDVSWRGVQDTPMRTRLGIVKVGGSTFEFALSTEAATFSDFVAAFNGMLTSFQPTRQPELE